MLNSSISSLKRKAIQLTDISPVLAVCAAVGLSIPVL